MSSLLLSSPNLSTPFLPRNLSGHQNTRNAPFCPFSRRSRIPRCAVDSPYGGNVPTFPRVNVWDPYKRLGVSKYASEEEIWGSRNFLLQQYAEHERSEESIEAAFEKLLTTSFRQRKKTKINLKIRLKKQVEESPPWIKNLLSFVELPPKEVIFRRLFLFAFMGGWSIMNSAEGGPAFQVAVSWLLAYISLMRRQRAWLERQLLGKLNSGKNSTQSFCSQFYFITVHL